MTEAPGTKMCTRCWTVKYESAFPFGGSFCDVCSVQGMGHVNKEKPMHQPMENEIAPTPASMLKEWNTKFGVVPWIEQPDDYGRKKFFEIRLRLLREEFNEAVDEILDSINGEGSIFKLAKELADLKYVIYGTEDSLDIPSEAVFAEVHRSNMSKLGPDGKPVLDKRGKILKGPNYSPADVQKAFGVKD